MMATPFPNIGAWYRLDSGEAFEVVACDTDDGTIEIQYFDGTVEELDIEDWELHAEERRLEEVEPPEDWSGSFDVDSDFERGALSPDDYEETRGMLAGPLEGLDIFE